MTDSKRAKILSPGEVTVLVVEHLAHSPVGPAVCGTCGGDYPCAFIRLAQSHEAMRGLVDEGMGYLAGAPAGIRSAMERLIRAYEGD